MHSNELNTKQKDFTKKIEALVNDNGYCITNLVFEDNTVRLELQDVGTSKAAVSENTKNDILKKSETFLSVDILETDCQTIIIK